MKDFDLNELARSIFNANKSEILNKVPLDQRKSRISSGSMLFDYASGGGIAPGCVYLTGSKESGKTSFSLECMRNMFSRYPKSRGVLFPTERPLTEELEKRSGLVFVRDPKDWQDGTCLVVETIVYEVVFTFIYKLIKANLENHGDTKFMFLIDSSNALARREDLEKGFEDAIKVAGGALMTSEFLKRIGLVLGTMGHHLFITGQDRAEIKASQYAPAGSRNRVGKSSGGNATPHYSLWCLDFQKAKPDDFFKNGKEIIGREVSIKLEKTPNETTGQLVSFPVKFKQVGRGSVWSEKEIIDVFLGWEVFEPKGAWINISEDFLEFAASNGVQLEPKYNGKDKLFESLSNIPGAIPVCFKFFQERSG